MCRCGPFSGLGEWGTVPLQNKIGIRRISKDLNLIMGAVCTDCTVSCARDCQLLDFSTVKSGAMCRNTPSVNTNWRVDESNVRMGQDAKDPTLKRGI